MKCKVIAVLGTRPEAIKLAVVIKELRRRSEQFETAVIHTGQHRTMLDHALKYFKINFQIPMAHYGELLDLKMKDVTLSNERISHVVVNGKTGMRKSPIVFSVPYLAGYFNDMRKDAKPDDPLLVVFDHSTPTNRPLDYPNVRKLLGDLKTRSKLGKRIYPHLFRHSRATYYASKLTEQEAKVYFGWSGDSAMMSKYVHLSGRDVDNAVARANGLEKIAESSKLKEQIRNCGKCHTINEITAKYCANCGSPLDIVEVMGEYDGLRQELQDLKGAVNLLMKSLDDDTKKKVISLLQK